MRYNQEYWVDARLALGVIPNLEQLKGRRILITGATGMICSTVVDLISLMNRECGADIGVILAGRSEARARDRFADSLADFEFIRYDATEDTRMDVRADYIIHGASNANPAFYASCPVETLMGNVIGLRCMLEVARANSGCRLLYISSSEVYGNRINGNDAPFKEEDYGYVDILNPRACYPNGKRAGETLCAAYGQEYGVDSVVVRPGHIYGPSITPTDNRASASFTRSALAGQDIIMKSSGRQLRSYCYTLDCASAILTVLLSGVSGAAYNISNRYSVVSIRQVAETFARAGGVRIIFEAPSILDQRGYNLMENSALDSEKLEGLGWKALFPLEKGVTATLLSGD